MVKHKEQRVGVLVDVSNMYHSAKNLYNKKVNFGEVLKKAVDGRKLIRAITYVIHTESEEENSFFEALLQQGFEVKMKDLQIFPGGMKKADWDVGIAMDAIKLSSNLDVIVLVSGDGDYIPLLEYIQNTNGTLVEVMGFKKTTSSRLIDQADDFVDLGVGKKFLQ
ncbi:NYN domain-containing protein [bacterium]|nr:NYN domain-containing protein [bacterium]